MAHGSRILFNDGEALTHGDLALLHDLVRRSVLDELAGYLAGQDLYTERGNGNTLTKCATHPVVCRPFGRALAARVGAGLNVYLDPGTVMQIGTAPEGPIAASNVAVNLISHNPQSVQVTFPAAHATLWRRDLVQYRLVQTNEAAVARDFRDAVTGALSSQNIVKRSNAVIETSVKSSANLASAALADNQANEPDPDSGWDKLCSVRVDPAATTLQQRYLWDWRKPAGHQVVRRYGNDWAFTHDDDEIVVDPSNGYTIRSNGSLARTIGCMPFGTGPNACQIQGWDNGAGTDVQRFETIEDHRRMRQCHISSEMQTGAPSAAEFELQHGNVIDITNPSWESNVIANATLLARFGTAESTFLLYKTPWDDPNDASGTADCPIWANGCRNPCTTGGNGTGSDHGWNTSMALLITKPAGAGVWRIFNLTTSIYGGLL